MELWYQSIDSSPVRREILYAWRGPPNKTNNQIMNKAFRAPVLSSIGLYQSQCAYTLHTPHSTLHPPPSTLHTTHYTLHTSHYTSLRLKLNAFVLVVTTSYEIRSKLINITNNRPKNKNRGQTDFRSPQFPSPSHSLPRSTIGRKRDFSQSREVNAIGRRRKSCESHALGKLEGLM